MQYGKGKVDRIYFLISVHSYTAGVCQIYQTRSNADKYSKKKIFFKWWYSKNERENVFLFLPDWEAFESPLPLGNMAKHLYLILKGVDEDVDQEGDFFFVWAECSALKAGSRHVKGDQVCRPHSCRHLHIRRSRVSTLRPSSSTIFTTRNVRKQWKNKNSTLTFCTLI